MSAPHRLDITTRRESSKVNAECSCGQWTMRNADRQDARESHCSHLDSELGPEAQFALAGEA